MLLIFDAQGTIFDTLRGLELGMPLWRVTNASHLERTERVDLAVVAAYAPGSWDGVVGRRPSETIVITTQFQPDDALLALGRGLLGYISHAMPQPALRATILGCLAGEPGYPRHILGRWLRAQDPSLHAHAGDALLTARQRQVLELVAEGFADKEIGERLGIATVTAQKHVTNILERLHVPNRAAAVAAFCGMIAVPQVTAVTTHERVTLAAAS